MKRGFLAAAFAALVVPSIAVAGTTTLVPGVRYERQVRLIGGSGVVLHILRAPRHGGLHWLRPVLSNGTVLGRETVPTMERRVSRRATVAGVNGDFFRFDTGQPTSVFLRDGVLANRPHPKRSSLGIAFDGRLVVNRFAYSGSWQAAGYVEHPLEEFNRRLRHPPGVALYTPKWGGVTPRGRTVRDVVLKSFPRVLPNGYQTGKVVGVRRGGGTTVPRGGAVLQARGSWSDVLVREARPGTLVTVHISLRNLPGDVADAIGGGPLLVRNGRAAAAPSSNTVSMWASSSRRRPPSATGRPPTRRPTTMSPRGSAPGWGRWRSTSHPPASKRAWHRSATRFTPSVV